MAIRCDYQWLYTMFLRRLNTVNMSALYILTYKFNEITVKNPMGMSYEC